MSNFIRYKKCEPVNLDLTLSIEYIKPALFIRFYMLLECDDLLYIDWKFDSKEEHDAVYNAIMKREVEEIKI